MPFLINIKYFKSTEDTRNESIHINTTENNGVAILIFAKIPREKFVKTRLSTSILSSEEILCLYEAFLLDTIEQSNKSNALQIIFSLTDTVSIMTNKLDDLPFFSENELKSPQAANLRETYGLS